jgi:hypothetical protein
MVSYASASHLVPKPQQTRRHPYDKVRHTYDITSSFDPTQKVSHFLKLHKEQHARLILRLTAKAQDKVFEKQHENQKVF